MDNIEQLKREARQSARRLVLISLALDALLGFGLGLLVADKTIERVQIVYPDC